MSKLELKKEKDKLVKFEKTNQDFFKNLEKYVSSLKAVYEAENVFYEDLKRIYSPEEEFNQNDVISGTSLDCVGKLTEHLQTEKSKMLPLLENIQSNVSRLQMESDTLLISFKKRFNDSESDRQILSEDFSIFSEQKGDTFDQLLLLLLKVKELKSNPLPQLSDMKKSVFIGHASSSNFEGDFPNCTSLVNNYSGEKYFRAFLAKEFSSENLDFYMDVEKFKKLTDKSSIESEANEIVNQYFKTGASKEVNVSADVMKKIEENMKSPDVHAFDDAQRNVMRLMETDSFTRFLKDPLYARLIKKLTKKDFLNYKRDVTMRRRKESVSGNLEGYKKEKEIMTERDWILLFAGAELITYHKEETITKIGEDYKHFFRIKSGKIRIEDEKKNILGYLAEGDIFGEMAFFDHKTSTNIYADSKNVVVHRIEDVVLCTLIQVDPFLSERFFQMLCTTLSYRLYKLPVRSAISKVNSGSEPTKTLQPSTSFPLSPLTDDQKKELRESSSQQGAVEEKDFELAELFELATDDILIKEYECSVKKKIKLHGSLYVFGKHLGFYSKVFGNVVKIIEPFGDITKIDMDNQKKLKVNTKKQKYTFYFSNSCVEALELIQKIWKLIISTKVLTNSSSNSGSNPPSSPRGSRSGSGSNKSVDLSASSDSPTSSPKAGTMSNPLYGPVTPIKLQLNDKEWESIFEIATLKRYNKNQDVLVMGEEIKRIYQIAEGSCRVELAIPTPERIERKVIGKMKAGEIFGEITYMFGGGANVCIVADTDQVKIYSIERSSLQELFATKPDLAAKFYKFLSTQIAKRLKVPKEQKKFITAMPQGLVKEKDTKEKDSSKVDITKDSFLNMFNPPGANTSSSNLLLSTPTTSTPSTSTPTPTPTPSTPTSTSTSTTSSETATTPNKFKIPTLDMSKSKYTQTSPGTNTSTNSTQTTTGTTTTTSSSGSNTRPSPRFVSSSLSSYPTNNSSSHVRQGSDGSLKAHSFTPGSSPRGTGPSPNSSPQGISSREDRARNKASNDSSGIPEFVSKANQFKVRREQSFNNLSSLSLMIEQSEKSQN